MKRLSNKGMTIIEVLVSFVLIMIITASMYNTVASFNQKRLIEDYKEQILTYKNTLTKEIQDDFIKIGLSHVNYNKTISGDRVTHTVDCDLKDGTRRQFIVQQQLAYSTYHIAGSKTEDDEFSIQYGTPPDDLIIYELPELGSSKNEYNHTVKDLSINNVLINISDENVLSIYVGFYHPELTTRYAIEIIAPINFVFSGAEFIDPSREIYLINYDLRGGQLPTGVTNPNMYTLSSPNLTLNNPTKPAAIFRGWTGSNGGAPETSVTIPTGSQGHKSYTANWDDFKCTITYNPNGGVFSKNASNLTQECEYGYGEEDACGVRSPFSGGFYKATREGYEICKNNPWTSGAGTYQSGDYATADLCPGILSGSGTITLSVNWAQNFSITYDTRGGTTPNNPKSYNSCSDSITLKNPKKDGYTFLGWTGSNGTTPSTNVVIPSGTSGNLSYVANWEQKLIDVQIHSAAYDVVTYKSSQYEGSFRTLAQGSSVVSLPAGRYTFKSTVGKKTDQTSSYERTVTIDDDHHTVTLFPAGAIYWYGNGSVPGSYLFEKLGGLEFEYTDATGTHNDAIANMGTVEPQITVGEHSIIVKAIGTEATDEFYTELTTYREFRKGSDYDQLRTFITGSNNTSDSETGTYSRTSLYLVNSNIKKEKFGTGSQRYFNLSLQDVGANLGLRYQVKSEVKGVGEATIEIHAIWLAKG